jgi:hypothetical protein
VKYAIAFGTDGTCGDTQYHPIPLPCPTKPTFEKLAEAFKVFSIKEGLYINEEEYDEFHSDLAGFWIIDERTKTAIEKIGLNESSDSVLYASIKCIKQMVEAMAVKIVMGAK